MESYVHVPYDEQALRRTLEFLLRPHVKRLRLCGAILVPMGVLLGVLGTTSPIVSGAIVVLGVVFAFAMKPYLLNQSLKQQWSALKADFRLDADEEWLSVSYPAFQSRYRWEALDKIIETPEAWFMVFGKVGASAVPKSAMTPAQAAEFSALIARRRPAVQMTR